VGWFNQDVYTQSQLIALVTKEALRLKLDPILMCAMVEQESGWDIWSIRFEPKFFSKYVAGQFTSGKITVTEAYSRSFSYGLLQVMGQTAREAGFDGTYLTELCDPQTNAGIGCYVFSGKLVKTKGDVTKALLLWNGGANPNYPTHVLARVPHYANVLQSL